MRLVGALALTPVAARVVLAAANHVSLDAFTASGLSFLGGALLPIVGLHLAAKSALSRGSTAFAVLLSGIALTIVALAPVPPLAAVLTSDTALVALAWGLGVSLGRKVQHAAHLLPACAVAAAADLASLLSPEGPSHAISHNERALSVLATWFPVPGSSALAPALGLGDLLFIGLLFGVAEAHDLPRVRCIAASLLGTLLAGAAALLLRAAIPALVPIAATVVLIVPQIRRVRRADRNVTVVSIAVAGALTATVLMRHWLLH